MRKRLLLPGVLVTALAVALPQLAGAALVTIAMRDDFFDPVTQNVVQNDQVQWTNLGANQHTATSDTSGLFDTGFINPGQTSAPITITLAPGTYRYFCQLHGAPGGIGMSGILVVAASGTTTTSPTTTTSTSTTSTSTTSTSTTSTSIPPTSTTSTSTVPPTTSTTTTTLPPTSTTTSTTLPTTTTTPPTTVAPTTTTPPTTVAPTTTSSTPTTVSPTTSTTVPPVAGSVCQTLLQARAQVVATIDALAARFPELTGRLSAIRDQALATIDALLRRFGCTVPAGPVPAIRLTGVDSPASALALARHVADEQVARALRAAGGRGRGVPPAFRPPTSITPSGGNALPRNASAGQGTPSESHVVSRGDSLWTIAQRHYGDGSAYPRIYEANRAQLSDPGRLVPDQVLTIPVDGNE